MTKEEIDKEQLKLKIKSLKGCCKKQGKKIKDQKKEIENLHKKLIKNEWEMADTSKKQEDIIKYINRLLDSEKKLDLDAVLITIKFMLLDEVDER